jgi:hypothetical protein
MNFGFWTLPPGGCPGEENPKNSRKSRKMKKIQRN